MNVVSHQIRDVLSPDQTLVYLQGAESQTLLLFLPGIYLLTLLPLSPLTVVLFAHLISVSGLVD